MAEAKKLVGGEERTDIVYDKMQEKLAAARGGWWEPVNIVKEAGFRRLKAAFLQE